MSLDMLVFAARTAAWAAWMVLKAAVVLVPELLSLPPVGST
ncbi:hypothetical protein ABZ770_41920 [Streptomyces sp. NPDC006654]